MKSYANKMSAKRALRKAGLSAMPVIFELVTVPGVVARERVVPVIQCELSEDVTEVRNRGFEAVKAKDKDPS